MEEAPEEDIPATPHPGLTVRDLIREEIAKIYVGREDVSDILLMALLAQGHVLVEGVPGIAKTTLVKAFAQTLGCQFARVQFTPDLLPGDITGSYVLNMKESTFELRQGPIFGNVVLGDEINRAPAKTQSALLEAMQEGQVTIEGQTLMLPQPFIVLATQNPVEQEGVYLLPEAQVDRFMVKVIMDYPTPAHEQRMLATYSAPVEPARAVVGPGEILQMTENAAAVFVADHMLDYIVRLVTSTRVHPAVLLGASPRASLALMRCSKAAAYISGRDHVVPDDIRALAGHVLNHRIILTPEAELDQLTSMEIVTECLNSTPYSQEM
jgi:MoxR-like ATPase